MRQLKLETMTDEEYQCTQALLFGTSHTLANLPLDAFLGRIRRAQALGPIVDPTLYRKAGDRLGDIERVAKAARRFQKELRDVEWLDDAGKKRVPDMGRGP